MIFRFTLTLALGVLLVTTSPPTAFSNTLSFSSIGDQDLLYGAPLHIGLDGTHNLGQNLTYTVTSNNPLVEASILSGNRSWQINTQDHGSMTFELFEQRVPRVTNQFIQLAEDDFFDGKEFIRVIEDFVIQATGAASPLPDFDDQFHVDLMHTSAGVLSMAKAAEDDNNAEFFVTDRITRWLDFHHSVFGVLTEGHATLDSTSGVPVDAQDRPVDPLIITDTQIITDNENGTLFLKSLADPTTITDPVEITVTATDEDNFTFEESFLVTVGDDTWNSNAFLLDDIPASIGLNVGEPALLDLTAFDVEGDDITFFAYIAPGITATFDGVNVLDAIAVTPIGIEAGTQLSITADATFAGGPAIELFVFDEFANPAGPTDWSKFDRQLLHAHIVAVPEPSTLVLGALAIVALPFLAQRRRQR